MTTTTPNDAEIEDWFGLIVGDDGWVTGVSPDGERQYDFGTHEAFYRDLIAAGFPLQCDRPPHGNGHLFVDFSLKPSLLPLCLVTAYGDAHPTPEHQMGEAGAVVHAWLDRNPDVTACIVNEAENGEYPEAQA